MPTAESIGLGRITLRALFATSLSAALISSAGCGDASSSASDASPPRITDESGASSSGDSSAGGAIGAANGGSTSPPPPVTLRRFGSDRVLDEPQYVAVRKSSTELPDPAHRRRCTTLFPQLASLPFLGNGHTCAIFNPYVLDTLKDAASRKTFFTVGFAEPKKLIGADSVDGRRLAVEVGLDLLNAPVEKVDEYLAVVLEGARAAKVPLLLNLDAFNWWDGRPDLWNFFDPKKPGYDPANIAKVEWTSHSPAGAPRMYWRNWGAQIRVDTPVPNFGAPTLRSEIKAVLDKIAPRLTDFIEGLAPDERYLFAGTIIGTELSIGVNHYVYPNTNAYVGQDQKCDPGTPYVAGCPAPAAGPCSAFNRSICPADLHSSPSGGLPQLGYHAAIDLGLLPNDAAPSRATLDGIVRSYVTFLRDVLVAEGLPSNKIYSHTGGTFEPNGPQSHDAAFAPSVIPGWTMYYGDTANPKSSVGKYVEASELRRAMPWASPEWLPLDPAGSDPALAWYAYLEASLNYRNNRMLSVANWEGVSPNPNARQGLATSLSNPAPGACVVFPRSVLGVARFDKTSVVRFSAAPPSTTVYLVASTTPAITPAGGLANADVANEVLSPLTISRTFGGGPKKVWLQLATDGCLRDGAAQRMLSPIVELDVGGGAHEPSSLRLFADRAHRIATLSWEGALPSGAKLELSRTADFAEKEEVSVGQAGAFYTDGFNAASPLHARLHAGSTTSNVVTLGGS